MSEPKDCGRCHMAGVPQVMPSGAIVTDDYCGGCPLKAGPHADTRPCSRWRDPDEPEQHTPAECLQPVQLPALAEQPEDADAWRFE